MWTARGRARSVPTRCPSGTHTSASLCWHARPASSYMAASSQGCFLHPHLPCVSKSIQESAKGLAPQTSDTLCHKQGIWMFLMSRPALHHQEVSLYWYFLSSVPLATLPQPISSLLSPPLPKLSCFGHTPALSPKPGAAWRVSPCLTEILHVKCFLFVPLVGLVGNAATTVHLLCLVCLQNAPRASDTPALTRERGLHASCTTRAHDSLLPHIYFGWASEGHLWCIY